MNREAALNESFGTNSELATAMRSLISEHPEIWRKGCNGDELSIDERVVYVQLMSAYNSFYFSRWSRARSGISGASPDRWTLSVAVNMYRHKGFRDTLRRVHAASPGEGAPVSVTDTEINSGGWPGAVERSYNQLVVSNVELPSDSDLCGI
jgi:hypothetical protein